MKSKYFSKCPQMWTDRSDVGMGTSRSLECTFVVIQTTICLRFNTSQPTTFFVLQIGGAWIRLVVCGCSISEFKKPNKWAMAGIWYTVWYGISMDIGEGVWSGLAGSGVGDTCIIVWLHCKYSYVIELIYLSIFCVRCARWANISCSKSRHNRTLKKRWTATNSAFNSYSFLCVMKQKTNNSCREICIKNALKSCLK